MISVTSMYKLNAQKGTKLQN